MIEKGSDEIVSRTTDEAVYEVVCHSADQNKGRVRPFARASVLARRLLRGGGGELESRESCRGISDEDEAIRTTGTHRLVRLPPKNLENANDIGIERFSLTP